MTTNERGGSAPVTPDAGIRCFHCGEAVSAEEAALVWADTDFVPHGDRGHYIADPREREGALPPSPPNPRGGTVKRYTVRVNEIVTTEYETWANGPDEARRLVLDGHVTEGRQTDAQLDEILDVMEYELADSKGRPWLAHPDAD